MTMSSGGGGAMYAFLACTASQFMTPTVITVKRQTTIFQLGALFEQHDFNAFPVMENGQVLELSPNSISFAPSPSRAAKGPS